MAPPCGRPGIPTILAMGACWRSDLATVVGGVAVCGRGEAELAAGGVPQDAAAVALVGYLVGQEGEQGAIVDAFRHPQEGPVRGPDAVIGSERVHERPDV